MLLKKSKKLYTKFIDEENEFWQNNDSADYIDWTKASKVSFTNLKPSTQTISLRLSASLLNEMKMLAHREDVPYQSLIKVFLAQAVQTARKTD